VIRGASRAFLIEGYPARHSGLRCLHGIEGALL
jgi:hypothetical protein